MKRLLLSPRSVRRPLLALLALVALVGGAITVFAYWTTGGAGTGSASAGTLQPVTVAALAGGDAPNSVLVPGGNSADVILRVTNPNSFAVTLVSVTGNGTITADTGHGGCTTTGVTFTSQSGLADAIAPGTTLVHLSGAASMSAGSSTGCQGATFSIPVAITVHK